MVVASGLEPLGLNPPVNVRQPEAPALLPRAYSRVNAIARTPAL